MRDSAADISKILLDGNYVTEENVKQASEFAKENKSSVVDYFLTNSTKKSAETHLFLGRR